MALIVKKLLPIKAHFFFFMAALGPILPQLQVFGKQLGVSSVIMGIITGILPFAYLLAKPSFGIIVDIYREHRKTIFILLIIIMATAYGFMMFIPLLDQKKYDFNITTLINKCDDTKNIATFSLEVDCISNCFNQSQISFQIYGNDTENISICNSKTQMEFENSCELKCKGNEELPYETLLTSATFWCFVVLLSIGTIAFNVVNSISDAVCFDVIGDEYDYGKQRTWGGVGYGLTALLSGYFMDKIFNETGSYKPAIFIMLIFIIFDLLACSKLKLPIIPPPKHIWKDLIDLMRYVNVSVFFIFTVIAGVADGFLTYFLLWFVEDMATENGVNNVKLLEGLIIAAETFGGEILFFYIGDNILKKLGHINCFTFCFICYSLRLGLISLVSSPWAIIGIEFFIQGPSYALTYVTIVAYANEIAPPGTSATMQGLAAGLDDGLGYAVGSLLGGFLYRFSGPRRTFQIFSAMSGAAGLLHLIIHKYFLKQKRTDGITEEAKYDNVPQECYS